MHANQNECEAAGVDVKEVERISRGLARYMKQAKGLGLIAFTGSNGFDLRYNDDKGLGHLVVSDSIAENADGGDGGTTDSDDGLLRGEF